MGTGWRRAFCTTIPRDPPEASTHQQQKNGTDAASTPSPRTGRKLGFLSNSRSNPSTPRMRCRTVAEAATAAATSGVSGGVVEESIILRCKTAPSSASNTPRLAKSPKKQLLSGSNPSSPRSPLKLSLFKNSFKFRSISCGICSSSVKTGHGTAIYTAECGHVFHFPCIADHVRAKRALICPVCNSSWVDVPLLAVHQNLPAVNDHSSAATRQEKTLKAAHVEDKRVAVAVHSSPRKSKLTVETARCYNDDEPLPSPAAGARFCPILEVEEDEEGLEQEDGHDGGEDIEEEFQGFFVNRNPSLGTFKYSDEVSVDDVRETRKVEVRLLPESTVVSVGRAHETYAVVLRVKAPPPPPPLIAGQAGTGSPHRAPIDLVAVLDVSGSMVGPKLQMLKRAMRLVISSLGPADRLSIVAFSTSSKRLLALRRMTPQGQQSARQIIDRLTCGHGSGVSDALRKAAKVLEDRTDRNPVASIMLLSDGQDPNSKLNQQPHLAPAIQGPPSRRFAHIEIPVHSFSFGSKRGYSHDPAEDTFARCVGGLLSVVVQDLRVQVSIPASSVAPAEIAAIYSCHGRPTTVGLGSIRVGDLYAGEEREFLVELKVAVTTSSARPVMSVRSCYKDPSTREVMYNGDRILVVPRPSAAARCSQLRALFLTTRAVAEARRLVDHHNDLTSAHHLLGSARALLIQGSSGGGAEDVEEHIRVLEAELAEVYWRNQQQVRGTNMVVDENGEVMTPTSAWRSAEKLAKVAIMKKSMSRVSDLHGFENARF
ncbi:hypothetical protein SAY87_000643 [Trapa incisa]|uniref:Zinc finger family protein n=1 Tax=Trapa incisa TaxID=236973 RepID=A0AAN7JGS6_9MYRT|nr:hypothetical protein SAY87_000643 [Trapa incisa]